MLLLIWFALDMTGFKIGGKYLVEKAFKDDGYWMCIYIACLILACFAGRVGKIVLLCQLSVWLIIQLLCHEWYLFFDNGPMGDAKDKIEFFRNTIKLFEIEGRYLPDLYHTILHVMIAWSIISVVKVLRRST